MLNEHKLPLITLILLICGLTACNDSYKSSATEGVISSQPDMQTGENQQQAPEREAPDSELDRLETADGQSEVTGESPVADAPPVTEELPAVVFMPLSAQQDVVEFVEVERYMGLWYEIATTPSFQQASCAGTTAEYVYNDAQGWVDVTNLCYVGGLSGTPQGVQGRAELVDTETQAKLNVIFFGASAPYWVVALDGSEGEDPYQWAVVSVPGGKTMWLLSRTPQISDDKRQAIEDHLVERGFPVDTLIDTLQGE